jgi:hypothetical protein
MATWAQAPVPSWRTIPTPCDLPFLNIKMQPNWNMPIWKHLTDLQGASQARRRIMLCKVPAITRKN